ncbi:MAG: biotin/lipoyl-binding protein, partial [Gammaproteobacteria bacterium]
MNDSTNASPTAAATSAPATGNGERLKKIRKPLMIGGSVLIVLIAAWLYFASARSEATNDAYVNAARVAISTNVPGRVIELHVRDNQRVKRGELLFRLDDRTYKLAVEQAQAKLATARLQVEALK